VVIGDLNGDVMMFIVRSDGSFLLKKYIYLLAKLAHDQSLL